MHRTIGSVLLTPRQAINIATDLWIIGMPIPMLLKLQLKLKKKIYLVLMFSVGIVYVPYLPELAYDSTSNIAS
jgi:hypothetical protein